MACRHPNVDVVERVTWGYTTYDCPDCDEVWEIPTIEENDD